MCSGDIYFNYPLSDPGPAVIWDQVSQRPEGWHQFDVGNIAGSNGSFEVLPPVGPTLPANNVDIIFGSWNDITTSFEVSATLISPYDATTSTSNRLRALNDIMGVELGGPSVNRILQFNVGTINLFLTAGTRQTINVVMRAEWVVNGTNAVTPSCSLWVDGVLEVDGQVSDLAWASCSNLVEWLPGQVPTGGQIPEIQNWINTRGPVS